MILTKAIEAAREALKRNIVCMEGDLDGSAMIHAETKQALAALPDKPLSEKELSEIISEVWVGVLHEATLREKALTAKDIIYLCIQTMKKANILYVEES